MNIQLEAILNNNNNNKERINLHLVTPTISISTIKIWRIINYIVVNNGLQRCVSFIIDDICLENFVGGSLFATMLSFVDIDGTVSLNIGNSHWNCWLILFTYVICKNIVDDN